MSIISNGEPETTSEGSSPRPVRSKPPAKSRRPAEQPGLGGEPGRSSPNGAATNAPRAEADPATAVAGAHGGEGVAGRELAVADPGDGPVEQEADERKASKSRTTDTPRGARRLQDQARCRLETLKGLILGECTALADLLRNAVDRKIRLGEHLAEARSACREAAVGWDEFLATIKLSDRTAREAMQFFKRRGVIERMRHGGAAPTITQVRLALAAPKKSEGRVAVRPVDAGPGDRLTEPRTDLEPSGDRAGQQSTPAPIPVPSIGMTTLVAAVGDDAAPAVVPPLLAEEADGDQLHPDSGLPLAGFSAWECIEMLEENEDVAKRLIGFLASGLGAGHRRKMEEGIRRAYAALKSLEDALSAAAAPNLAARPDLAP